MAKRHQWDQSWLAHFCFQWAFIKLVPNSKGNKKGGNIKQLSRARKDNALVSPLLWYFDAAGWICVGICSHSSLVKALKLNQTILKSQDITLWTFPKVLHWGLMNAFFFFFFFFDGKQDLSSHSDVRTPIIRGTTKILFASF